jgi:hypothetical protein
LERTLYNFPWLSPPTVEEEIDLEDQATRPWFTKLWEAVYEEVDEVPAKVPENKEERLKTIEEKLNALSEKYEMREKKIEEQLRKIQTMLENEGK